MDGYSVKDAALVLGIPERRVWELIARGVLASAREGPDGMRVFLQPRTTPIDPAAAEPHIYRADEPDPQRQNGNGGNGGSHEMSPFRELLTEFRSLTERYGQALLALGEARGEVASLRSRVELLEARMDLRLPGTRPASTAAWDIPAYPPQEPSPPAEQDDATGEGAEAANLEEEPLAQAAEAEPVEAQADGADVVETAAADGGVKAPFEFEAPAAEPSSSADAIPEESGEPSKARKRRADSRRRKIKGGRTALAGIAEALARAEDPTLAELPGADDAAEALAALQRDIESRQAAGTDAAPVEQAEAPDEAILADEIQVAEPGDAALASAAELESVEEQPDEPELYATVSMSAVSVPAAELVADEEMEPAAEEPADVMEVSFEAADQVDAPEPAAEVATAPNESSPAPEEFEPVVAVVEVDSAPEPVVEPVAAAEDLDSEPEPAEEPEPPHELVAAPDSPYSTEVVEPDWFADGDFTWLEAAQAEAVQQAAAPTVEQEAESPERASAAPEVESPPEIESAPGPETSTADEPMAPAAPVTPDAMAPEPAPEPEAQASPSIGFEPSAHDELRAEEEARAAIQDAFAEHDEGDTSATAHFESPVQEAVAPAEPAMEERGPEEPQYEEPIAEEPAEAAIQDAFGAPAIEEMELAAEDARIATDEIESQPEAPGQEGEPSAFAREPEAEAIQDAFSEPEAADVQSMEPHETEAAVPDEQAEQQEAQAFESAPTPVYEQEPSVAPEPESPAQPTTEPMQASVTAAPQPEAAPPPAAQGQRGEEELMWLGDEFEEASLEIASQGWRSADATPQAAQPPTLELSDAELSQLAEDEGWDSAEVEAIRSLLGRPTPPMTDGVDDQLTPAAATPPVIAEQPDVAAPAPAPRPVQRHSMSSMSDPQWLKGRRGPAATAYRRLRRLFPG